MNKQHAFFKDELVGTFPDNILTHIASLFPLSVAEYVRNQCPIHGRWSLYERITWEGHHGYRYYTEKGMSSKVLAIMMSIYENRHTATGYPTIFDGTADEMPKFCLNIDYIEYNLTKRIIIDKEYFVIWLFEDVKIPVENIGSNGNN